MKNKKFKFQFSNLISQIILLIISVLIFVLANPNILVKNGLGFLGFFIYLPVLYVVTKSNLKNAWAYGLVYGALSYGIYGYWLTNFHPLGLTIVCICYAVILAIVFEGLKIIQILFNRKAWLVQFIFICAYEYVKTLGFTGFSYGVSAYTMWRTIHLIQIVDIIGVFGLNLIVIFPSFFIFAFNTKQTKNLPAYIWGVFFIFAMLYGFVDVKKGNPSQYITVAAIQNNEDSWKNGINEYQENVNSLINLTEEAKKENTDIDLVVWPETAIAPSILANYYGKEDFKRYELVYNLLKFLNKQSSYFVIGNANQSELKDGSVERYNSAFLFKPGENVIPPEPDVYSKIKLVPFTEDFPYKNQFPKLYEKLLNGDTHMWDKGNEYTVFKKDDFSFSTPICFEDTFGYVCRKMVRNGSRAFINLSNDSWSKSEVCQYQHLAMAVFRSVENRVPSVRSTSSGQTCIINQHGKVVEMAEPFTKSFVVGKVPVYGKSFKESVYTKTGDLFGILEVVITAVILIIQIIRVIIIKLNNKSA